MYDVWIIQSMVQQNPHYFQVRRNCQPFLHHPCHPKSQESHPWGHITPAAPQEPIDTTNIRSILTPAVLDPNFRTMPSLSCLVANCAYCTNLEQSVFLTPDNYAHHHKIFHPELWEALSHQNNDDLARKLDWHVCQVCNSFLACTEVVLTSHLKSCTNADNSYHNVNPAITALRRQRHNQNHQHSPTRSPPTTRRRTSAEFQPDMSPEFAFQAAKVAHSVAFHVCPPSVHNALFQFITPTSTAEQVMAKACQLKYDNETMQHD